MLFAGREDHIRKNCAQGLVSTAQLGRRPRAVLKNEGTVFPNTDRPRPANNVFFSLENYFLRNICVDFFTEAVSHHAHAFDISVKQTRVVYRSI